MPDLVSIIAGTFTVLGVLAIYGCLLGKRISRGDFTRFRGLDRLHK